MLKESLLGWGNDEEQQEGQRYILDHRYVYIADDPVHRNNMGLGPRTKEVSTRLYAWSCGYTTRILFENSDTGTEIGWAWRYKDGDTGAFSDYPYAWQTDTFGANNLITIYTAKNNPEIGDAIYSPDALGNFEVTGREEDTSEASRVVYTLSPEPKKWDDVYYGENNTEDIVRSFTIERGLETDGLYSINSSPKWVRGVKYYEYHKYISGVGNVYLYTKTRTFQTQPTIYEYDDADDSMVAVSPAEITDFSIDTVVEQTDVISALSQRLIYITNIQSDRYYWEAPSQYLYYWAKNATSTSKYIPCAFSENSTLSVGDILWCFPGKAGRTEFDMKQAYKVQIKSERAEEAPYAYIQQGTDNCWIQLPGEASFKLLKNDTYDGTYTTYETTDRADYQVGDYFEPIISDPAYYQRITQITYTGNKIQSLTLESGAVLQHMIEDDVINQSSIDLPTTWNSTTYDTYQRASELDHNDVVTYYRKPQAVFPVALDGTPTNKMLTFDYTSMVQNISSFESRFKAFFDYRTQSIIVFCWGYNVSQGLNKGYYRVTIQKYHPVTGALLDEHVVGGIDNAGYPIVLASGNAPLPDSYDPATDWTAKNPSKYILIFRGGASDSTQTPYDPRIITYNPSTNTIDNKVLSRASFNTNTIDYYNNIRAVALGVQGDMSWFTYSMTDKYRAINNVYYNPSLNKWTVTVRPLYESYTQSYPLPIVYNNENLLTIEQNPNAKYGMTGGYFLGANGTMSEQITKFFGAASYKSAGDAANGGEYNPSSSTTRGYVYTTVTGDNSRRMSYMEPYAAVAGLDKVYVSAATSATGAVANTGGNDGRIAYFENVFSSSGPTVNSIMVYSGYTGNISPFLYNGPKTQLSDENGNHVAFSTIAVFRTTTRNMSNYYVLHDKADYNDGSILNRSTTTKSLPLYETYNGNLLTNLQFLSSWGYAAFNLNYSVLYNYGTEPAPVNPKARYLNLLWNDLDDTYLNRVDTWQNPAISNHSFMSSHPILLAVADGITDPEYATLSIEPEWSVATINPNLVGENRRWGGVAFGANKFVALGQTGYISTSSDGITWSTATQNANLGNRSWNNLAYGANKFVALSQTGYISTSTDGTTWSAATQVANLSAANTSWRSITWDGSKFVALGQGGYISTSTNGTTWSTATQVTNLGNNAWSAVAFGAGKFTALSQTGYTSTSTNGTTWSVATQNANLGDNSWVSLGWNGSKFIALSQTGYISTSTDGITWSTATQNTNLGDNSWVSLVYGADKFIALSQSSYLSNLIDGLETEITCGGVYTQESKIILPVGSLVSYSASKTGYITNTGTITLTEDTRIPIQFTLDGSTVTFTLTPVPADATVTLSGPSGIPVSGTGTQSIDVVAGSTVNYEVSKTDFETKSSTTPVYSNLNMTVAIEIPLTSVYTNTNTGAWSYTVDGKYNYVEVEFAGARGGYARAKGFSSNLGTPGKGAIRKITSKLTNYTISGKNGAATDNFNGGSGYQSGGAGEGSQGSGYAGGGGGSTSVVYNNTTATVGGGSGVALGQSSGGSAIRRDSGAGGGPNGGAAVNSPSPPLSTGSNTSNGKNATDSNAIGYNNGNGYVKIKAGWKAEYEN